MVPPGQAKLQEILDRGYFTYGLEATYKPYGFRDDQNNIVGYDIDVANEIGKRLGVEARPIDTSWPVVIETLYKGDFDVIIGGMTATKERNERVDFSVPYMDASTVMIIKVGSGIEAPKDLDGKVVGGAAGTPSIPALENAANREGITYKDGVKGYDDDTVAFEALRAGRLDGYLTGLVNAATFVETAPEFTTIPFPIPEFGVQVSAMAFRQEDEGLRAMFNGLILSMKEDGTLAQLQEKWFGKPWETPDTPPAWK